MALTQNQKQEIVSEVKALLDSSKMTVIANYKGVKVKQLQELRRQAKENGTKVKVIKNRLVIKALSDSEKFKSIDTTPFTAQLIYAFNDQDEVAAAQVLAKFAKTTASLEFVGAITDNAEFISSAEVKILSSLPSKDQLRGQLVGTISAPLSGFVNILNGNLRGVLNVLSARAEVLNS